MRQPGGPDGGRQSIRPARTPRPRGRTAYCGTAAAPVAPRPPGGARPALRRPRGSAGLAQTDTPENTFVCLDFDLDQFGVMVAVLDMGHAAGAAHAVLRRRPVLLDLLLERRTLGPAVTLRAALLTPLARTARLRLLLALSAKRRFRQRLAGLPQRRVLTFEMHDPRLCVRMRRAQPPHGPVPGHTAHASRPTPKQAATKPLPNRERKPTQNLKDRRMPFTVNNAMLEMLSAPWRNNFTRPLTATGHATTERLLSV